MYFKNLTNKKFGNLTAIRVAGKTDRNNILWECNCECGGSKIVKSENLLNGRTRSCGCLRNRGGIFHHNFIDGLAGTRFYTIWHKMKGRGTGKSCRKYYADKNIKICDEWLSFQNFKRDMYLLYNSHCEEFGEKQTTIERIDFRLGYNKDNCKWATPKEQSNNRRNVAKIPYNGSSLTLGQWSDKTGILRKTLATRLRNGWSVEKALTLPKQDRNYKVNRSTSNEKVPVR